MIFGISKQDLARVTIIGACLGAVVLSIAVPAGISHGTIRSAADVARCFLQCLGLAAILPTLIGAGGLITLRIDDGDITQMIGPWAISKRPMNELLRVSFDGRVFPVTLRFQDGTHYRLLAFNLGDRRRLAEYLKSRAPHAIFE